LAQTKGIFEELDQWLRRKLRCILWRQWKRRRTCAQALLAHGLDREPAFASACNGRGPWWNAGPSHMHAAYPASFFRYFGLLSLQAMHRRLNNAA
jgi:hypothetical protein